MRLGMLVAGWVYSVWGISDIEVRPRYWCSVDQLSLPLEADVPNEIEVAPVPPRLFRLLPNHKPHVLHVILQAIGAR